ncbi:MAG: hypothetical protein K2O73_01540 [Lachnospiraceae bacterium]|nr:hypothetical protein [Lachnospiraceae bacterium]
MGVLLTVSAVTTAIFALPLVFGLYGTTTGIVATGVTTAAYAGAYTYQGSNLIEGVNSFQLAEGGDAAGIAVNPIRDTIFANNPELYYTLGEISTMVALSTPSIASSMSMAVRLGVSPTRAALTEMGMLGGSEIAGRYVEAGVYEQTGDQRLANMARSGTSLLVYGGLAYTDARIGMSGIRHWKTPRVNPLEFQPPEQTFPEPNALVNQGKPSTYPAMPGSMSREEIEGYLASLRNESPQGLKVDGVSGPGILELGNSDGGVEDVSRTGKLNELRNLLPDKYQIVDSFGNKVGNIAYSTSDIEGHSIEELKSFSKYGSIGKNGIKNSMDGWVSSVENAAYSNEVLKINSDNEIDAINGYLRNNDTEYKIIEQYNQILEGDYEVKGKITIVSEREICPGCDNVIKAFSKDYSNIEITLIDGTGKTYIVKAGIVQ